MKLCFWFRTPSPLQSSFLRALRESGVTLRVIYIDKLQPHRVALGWRAQTLLPDEQFLEERDPLEIADDLDLFVHVIAGYSHAVLRAVASRLSKAGTQWVHMSEPARPGMRWLLSYPLKRWYANRINTAALGAFGYGRNALRDFRRWGVKPCKLASTWYAVDRPDGVPLSPNLVREDVRFLFVGSLCRRKGIDLLLEAFATTDPRRSRSHLTCIGDGPERQSVERTIEELGLSESVTLAGAVARDEVWQLGGRQDVFILPSRFDGWGAVLNEAAASGLALIATESTGAAHHLIRQGVNGFRVKPNSAEQLALAMGAYRDNRDLVEAHRAASLEVFEEFTPARCASHCVEQIEQWQDQAA